MCFWRHAEPEVDVYERGMLRAGDEVKLADGTKGRVEHRDYRIARHDDGKQLVYNYKRRAYEVVEDKTLRRAD